MCAPERFETACVHPYILSGDCFRYGSILSYISCQESSKHRLSSAYGWFSSLNALRIHGSGIQHIYWLLTKPFLIVLLQNSNISKLMMAIKIQGVGIHSLFVVFLK